MSRPTRTALILVALSLGAALPATAEEPRATLERAVLLYSGGEFDRSRALLEGMLSRPETARQPATLRARARLYLGLNEAAAGRLTATRRHFTAALRLNPAIQIKREQLKTEVVEILDELRRKLRATLVVETNVSGATVLVDGRAVGTAPYRGDHAPGKHRIEVRPPTGVPPRHAPRSAEVELPAGATRRLTLSLLALRPRREERPLPPKPGRRPRILRTLAWITGAGALATSGTAVGLGVVALDRRDEADAFARTGDPSSADDQQHHFELVDASKRMVVGCNVTWGVAGALALTSAALFVWDRIRVASAR